MNRKKVNDNLIGEAIRRNRQHSNMTAKALGLKVGFSEATADTRISQYECGDRVPSPGTAEALAKILGISKYALLPIDISTDEGMFFAIMKIMSVYDVRIGKLGENFCLLFPNTNNKAAHYFNYLYNANKLYREGKITADDYMFVMDGIDICKGTEYMEGVASIKRTTPRNIDTDFHELLNIAITEGLVIKDGKSFFVGTLSTLKEVLSKAEEFSAVVLADECEQK